MNFKEATDALCDRVDHSRLAKALNVSVALIRQARLQSNASAHRSAPADWEKAVIRLAENQAIHYRRLASKLRRGE